MRRVLLLGMLLIIIVIFAACSRPILDDSSLVYVADAWGYNDFVGVELVMGDDYRIVDILVVWHKEGPEPYLSFAQDVVDWIIANNTTIGVNVFNGATATSRAIVEAVNEVLGRFGLHSTEFSRLMPFGILPEPGPYVAFACGWGDGGTTQVGVRVNFSHGYTAIESIDFYPNRETPAFVDIMHPLVVDKIIELQSTDLPQEYIYNGATITTKALLAAVQEVLDRVMFPLVP